MTTATFTSADVAHIAEGLVAARQGKGPLLATPAKLPATSADAYRVQDAVIAGLGIKVSGWKVGAPSPTAEPTCAPIYAGTVELPVAPNKAAISTGVELEIAYRLSRPFGASDVAPTTDTILEAIDSAFIVLETCVSRLADGIKGPPLLCLADNGSNLGLIMGPRLANWRHIDAKKLRAIVEADGKVIADVTGGHSHGDLLELLIWQVGHCVTKRGGLAAGTVITTGSCMGIRWVDVPARVKGTFEGLGMLDVALVPGRER